MLSDFLREAGMQMGAIFDDAKIDARVRQAVWERRGANQSLEQQVQSVIEEYNAEQQEIRNNPPEPNGTPQPIPAEESVTGEAIPAEDPLAVADNNPETGDFRIPTAPTQQDERGRGLKDNKYAETGNGSVIGMVDPNTVKPCPEVQQFKTMDTAAGRTEAREDGTVRDLPGKWNPLADPVFLLRRKNGELQIISGRHRLAHAKKNGVKYIKAEVWDESDKFDIAWARRQDVAHNILQGTANATDIAVFFRGNPITYDEANALGFIQKKKNGEDAKASVMGITIALHASDEIYTRLINGKVAESTAFQLASMFPDNERRQLEALDHYEAGESWTSIAWYVNSSVEDFAAADGLTQGNLFGEEESAGRRKLADYVGKVEKRIRALINVLKDAKRIQRNPSLARELNFNFSTETDVIDTRTQLEILLDAYQHPKQGEMEEVKRKAAAWDGKSKVEPSLSELIGEARLLVPFTTAEAAPVDTMDDLFASAAIEAGDGDIVRAGKLSTVDEAKAKLKLVQGKTFVNKPYDVSAMVTGSTLSKANAAQMSIANLKRFGYSSQEARQIHYSAYAHIHELFENSKWGFFEENYDAEKKKGRKGAWHHFGVVEIEGAGAFAVNVTSIVPEQDFYSNKIFSLELTIENPVAKDSDTLSQRGLDINATGLSGLNLAAFRSFVEKEMLHIRKKSEADGTFMKAPNGKPSNLSREQWLIVRTRAFKAWFGDWENDPQNASKVLDENGEPLVVWHGARRAGFRVFDDTEGEKQSAAPKGAMFFSDSKEVAISYAGTEEEPDLSGSGDSAEEGRAGVYPVFLNIRDPHVVDFNGDNWSDHVYYTLMDERGDYVYDENGENFKSEADAEKRAKELGLENYEIYSNYQDPNIVADEASDMGLDGAIIRNVIDEGSRFYHGEPATDYIVFGANNIKSATQNRGTFDANSYDITLAISTSNPDDIAAQYANARKGSLAHRMMSHARAEANRFRRVLLKPTTDNEAAQDLASVLIFMESAMRYVPTARIPRMTAQRNALEAYIKMMQQGRIGVNKDGTIRRAGLTQEQIDAVAEQAAAYEEAVARQDILTENKLTKEQAKNLQRDFIRAAARNNIGTTIAGIYEDIASSIAKALSDKLIDRMHKRIGQLQPFVTEGSAGCFLFICHLWMRAAAPTSHWHDRVTEFLPHAEAQGMVLLKTRLPPHWETRPLWK